MASASINRVGHPSIRTGTMRMRNLLAAGVIVGAFACSKSNQPNVDSLALAARNQATLDSISAAERARATPAPAALAPTTSPTKTRTVYVPERTTTSSGGTVVKHTKRDAEIGAAAGAVIGA